MTLLCMKSAASIKSFSFLWEPMSRTTAVNSDEDWSRCALPPQVGDDWFTYYGCWRGLVNGPIAGWPHWLWAGVENDRQKSFKFFLFLHDWWQLGHVSKWHVDTEKNNVPPLFLVEETTWEAAGRQIPVAPKMNSSMLQLCTFYLRCTTCTTGFSYHVLFFWHGVQQRMCTANIVFITGFYMVSQVLFITTQSW